MIFILIPIFNEEENLNQLAKNLFEIEKNNPDHYFYVFVDDYSKDNSVQIIYNLFPNDRLKVICKEENIGPGDSFNQGFEWIIQNFNGEKSFRSSLIVTLESDNTSDLSILPVMISLANQKFDLVLASVYAQGGGFEKLSFFRVFLSFFANMLFRALFNIKTLTLSSFYRVYKTQLICKLHETYPKIISERGFISMLEILLKTISIEAHIIEVPMKLSSLNRKGKSKMKIIKTTISYIKFLLFTGKPKSK
jgi:glycosyltransferase involved in cell wall biosynthesis